MLEIIHATAYLWDTANGWLGETQPHRTAWVRSDLEPVLAGQMEAVITALEAEAHDPACTATQRPAVPRTIGYYRRNRPSRRDDEDLAPGLAHWHEDDRGRLWASGERSPGAVREALDESRGAGGTRPAGRAEQWALGARLAVSSATATPTALSQRYARARAGGKPPTGVGGVMNPLSTDFGHTHLSRYQ